MSWLFWHAVCNIISERETFPKMKLKDPFAKKGLKTWQKCLITFGVITLTICALWIFNVLSYINPKIKSPLPRFNKVEAVEEVVSDSLNVEHVEVVEEVVTK